MSCRDVNLPLNKSSILFCQPYHSISKYLQFQPSSSPHCFHSRSCVFTQLMALSVFFPLLRSLHGLLFSSSYHFLFYKMPLPCDFHVATNYEQTCLSSWTEDLTWADGLVSQGFESQVETQGENAIGVFNSSVLMGWFTKSHCWVPWKGLCVIHMIWSFRTSLGFVRYVISF